MFKYICKQRKESVEVKNQEVRCVWGREGKLVGKKQPKKGRSKEVKGTRREISIGNVEEQFFL